MLVIKAKTPNEAWRKTLKLLMEEGTKQDNNLYHKDEVTLIEIENPCLEVPDSTFPMHKNDIDTICKYIVSGENENKVNHKWTKIYYHRIFDEPHSQMEFMIKKLKESFPTGEAQISMWNKMIDQDKELSPCTQILWARIKQGKLEFHTHAHSSDAYKKLLMNILEFVSVQYYVAKRLNIEVGTYYHFIDSCHVYSVDKEKAIKLMNTI